MQTTSPFDNSFDSQADYFEKILPALTRIYDSFIVKGVKTLSGLSGSHLFSMLVNSCTVNSKLVHKIPHVNTMWDEFLQVLLNHELFSIAYDNTCCIWMSSMIIMFDFESNNFMLKGDENDYDGLQKELKRGRAEGDFDAAFIHSLIRGDETARDVTCLAESHDGMISHNPYEAADCYIPNPEQSYQGCSEEGRRSLEFYSKSRGVSNFSQLTFESSKLETAQEETVFQEGAVWSAATPIIPALYSVDREKVTLLDVGAGDGVRSEVISSALKGVSVTSIDVHAVPFSSVLQLDHRFLKTEFDIVLLNMVVHHVSRIDRSWVAGIADRIRPGGMLVLRDHDWDGSLSHKSYLDALHCVHSQIGGGHSDMPISQYHSQDALIRLFAREGLIYCPAADPSSNYLYSGGGRSNAVVLYFTKSSLLDFHRPFLGLMRGIAVMHQFFLPESYGLGGVEMRMGVPVGYFCQFAHDFKRPWYNKVVGAVFGGPLIAETAYGQLLKNALAARGRSSTWNPLPKGVRQPPTKVIKNFSNLAKEGIAKAQIAQSKAITASTPNFLSGSEMEADFFKPALLSADFEKMAVRLAAQAEMEKQEAINAIPKDEDATSAFGARITRMSEEKLEASSEPITLATNNRDYTIGVISTLAPQLLLECVEKGCVSTGFSDSARRRVTKYLLTEDPALKKEAFWWIITVACRLAHEEPITVHDLMKSFSFIMSGISLNKKIANSVLYGLMDCGWMRQRLTEGPPKYRFDPVSATSLMGKKLSKGHGLDKRF